MSELMTLEEVANYLRVTEKTIYRFLDKRKIPATKVGHQWRFDKDAIDAWLYQSSNEIKTSVIVIDDDQTICSLFKDTLEDAECKVTTVGNPLEGLELIKKGKYDLAFLDLKLPGIDGAELFRQIREAKPEIFVIVVTGYPESNLMMRALNYGPLGIVKKPFKPTDIITILRSYLKLTTLEK